MVVVCEVVAGDLVEQVHRRRNVKRWLHSIGLCNPMAVSAIVPATLDVDADIGLVNRVSCTGTLVGRMQGLQYLLA